VLRQTIRKIPPQVRDSGTLTDTLSYGLALRRHTGAVRTPGTDGRRRQGRGVQGSRHPPRSPGRHQGSVFHTIPPSTFNEGLEPPTTFWQRLFRRKL